MYTPLNKFSLALAALGLAMANGQVLAQAAAPAPAPAFTWYGTLSMAAENSDDGSFIRNTSQTLGSKLGIKGETAINTSLKAMFQIETGVAQDDSANSKAFANRNSFVGLDSPSFGRVLLGTYDMPFKDLKGSNAKFDGNDDVVEIAVNGKGLKNSATANLFTDNAHTRQTNVVYYASPKFNNMQAKVAYGLDEPASNANTVLKKPVYGASFEYNDGSFNAGLAFETKENFSCTVATCLQNTVNGNLNARKVTIGWQGGDIGLGLVFGALDNGLSGTFSRASNTAALTGTYKMGDYTYRAGYGMSSESSAGLSDDFNMLSLEVAYALNKTVNVYGYYSMINNNTGAKARFEGGENKYSPVAGNDPRVLGAGISYSF